MQIDRETGSLTLRERLLAFLGTSEEQSVQLPLTVFIMQWSPLIVTDTFDCSIQIENSELEKIVAAANEKIDGTYTISLLNWSFFVKQGAKGNSHDDIQASCRNFRVTREPEDLIEVDMVPPDMRQNPEVLKLYLRKIMKCKPQNCRAKSCCSRKRIGKAAAETEEACNQKGKLKDTGEESTASSVQDLQNNLSLGDLLNTSLQAKKKSALSKANVQLNRREREGPLTRQRSRSKSVSKARPVDVISLSSDEKGEKEVSDEEEEEDEAIEITQQETLSFFSRKR